MMRFGLVLSPTVSHLHSPHTSFLFPLKTLQLDGSTLATYVIVCYTNYFAHHAIGVHCVSC